MTTEQMCAHESTRTPLLNTYFGAGALLGAGLSWIFGDAGFFTVLAAMLLVWHIARAERARAALASTREEG